MILCAIFMCAAASAGVSEYHLHIIFVIVVFVSTSFIIYNLCLETILWIAFTQTLSKIWM